MIDLYHGIQEISNTRKSLQKTVVEYNGWTLDTRKRTLSGSRSNERLSDSLVNLYVSDTAMAMLVRNINPIQKYIVFFYRNMILRCV